MTGFSKFLRLRAVALAAGLLVGVLGLPAIANVSSFPSTIAALTAIYNQLVGGNIVTNASANTPSLSGLTVLGTLAANSSRKGYLIQTQDTATDCGLTGPAAQALLVAFDDGSGNNLVTMFLDYPSVKYRQGAAISMAGMPHTGRIRYYAAPGCVVLAVQW